jgi:hypothetical protein
MHAEHAERVGSSNVVVMGDSAGGGISLANVHDDNRKPCMQRRKGELKHALRLCAFATLRENALMQSPQPAHQLSAAPGILGPTLSVAAPAARGKQAV